MARAFSTNNTYADYFREHVNFVLIVKLNYGDMTASYLVVESTIAV